MIHYDMDVADGVKSVYRFSSKAVYPFCIRENVAVSDSYRVSDPYRMRVFLTIRVVSLRLQLYIKGAVCLRLRMLMSAVDDFQFHHGNGVFYSTYVE